MPWPEYPCLPAEDGQIYRERLIAILGPDNEMIGALCAPNIKFHRYVKAGLYLANWGEGVSFNKDDKFGE
jgi:hypothetical protein